MIFRALVAIGVVALMTPHEPDLGLGRPGAGATLPSPAPSSAIGLSRTGGCGNPACAGALAFASMIGLTPPAGRSLEDVKSEIDKDISARKTAL